MLLLLSTHPLNKQMLDGHQPFRKRPAPSTVLKPIRSACGAWANLALLGRLLEVLQRLHRVARHAFPVEVQHAQVVLPLRIGQVRRGQARAPGRGMPEAEPCKAHRANQATANAQRGTGCFLEMKSNVVHLGMPGEPDHCFIQSYGSVLVAGKEVTKPSGWRKIGVRSTKMSAKKMCFTQASLHHHFLENWGREVCLL